MRTEKIFSDQEAVVAAQNIEEKKFWLNTLSGELIKTYFPPNSSKRNNNERSLDFVKTVLPDELFSRLTELSKSSDVRFFIILAAVMAILLTRYTHNKDIIMGTSIYRQDSGTEFIINSILPLRIQLQDHMIFKELLLHVNQVIFDAYKHQNYPINVLLNQLGMTHVKDENFPLFDVAVLLDNIHDREYLRRINLNTIFAFRRMPGGLELTVEYNSAIYRKGTIERIILNFIHLGKQVIFKGDARVSHVEILAEEERRQVLFYFNDTKTRYSRDKTMDQLFEEQVERTPRNVAIIGESGGPGGQRISLTYMQLNERANQLALELRKEGLKPNSFVAVIMDRSIEMVLGVMAILKSGGTYVPLEPYLPEERKITCLSSLKVEMLLANHLQLNMIAKISEQLPALKHIFCLDNIEDQALVEDLFKSKTFISPGEIEKNPGKNLAPAACADDTAYVIFTSGTTGTPKGVVVKHRPVINLIEWVNNTFNVSGSDKLLFVVSLSFDLSVYDIFGILASGGSVRVAGGDEIKSPERLLDIIFQEGITFWDSAPAALQILVPYLQNLHDYRHYTNKSKLRLVFLSGDWIPLPISDILKEVFAGVRVIGLGGATETTIWSNYYPIEGVNPEWNSIPYGKPIQNARYYILDQELNPCPIDVPGDLYIGGECLASGYINDVALSAKKFIDNPFVPGGTMYRTGDQARWFPDGNMEFLGRLDNQVKIRGYRIELGEIESQLLMHENLKEAVVVARGEAKGNKYLCAYYVAENHFTPGELSQYLSKTLPQYMIPPYFVKLDKMPLTSNGKIDRKTVLESEFTVETDEYTAPRCEVEEKLVEIWSEVLGIEKEKISINADFFQMGGHSLSAIQMVSMIHKELSVKIPLAEIFRITTIKEQAQTIKTAAENRYASIDPTEKKEYYSLSSTQKRLYILQQMQSESTSYNMPHLMPWAEDIEKEKYEEIFRKLIARHESLRTSFERVEDESVQKIRDHVDIEIEFFNLATKTYDGSRGVKNFIRPFDLSQAPLVRVGLLKTEKGKYILMLDMHHIISDGISQLILSKEFMSLYRGEELPRLKLQYRDYAEWEKSGKQKELMNQQEEYWLQLFSAELPVLNLPNDYQRPEIQSFEGSTEIFEFTEEETEMLKDISKEEEVTLYMYILALFNILLSKLSGEDDIIVGIPLAARRHSDLEQIIGMFVNTLPLRNYPSGYKTFKQFLKEVKEQTLKAYENQEYHFEDLVDKILVRRDTSRNPVFDVTFNLFEQFEDSRDSLVWREEIDYEYKNNTSKFDLNLTAIDMGERLLFNIEYCTKLFKECTIHRIIQYFKRVVRLLSENREQELSNIEIITDEEKKQLIVEFNDNKTDFPKDKTICQLFEQQVKKSPNRMALIFSDNQLTYGELNKKTSQLARTLREKGVKSDVIVGLMVERSIEMVVGLLAILKAGSAYLPIELDFPLERKQYILTDCNSRILLTTRSLFKEGEKVKVRRWKGEMIFIDDSSEPAICNLQFSTRSSNLAYIIYTSGTSGKPKGVLTTHYNVTRVVRNTNYIELTEHDRVLQLSNYAFDGSVFDIYGAFLNGAVLVMLPGEKKSSIEELSLVINREKITVFFVTTAFFNLLVDEKPCIFDNIRKVLFGGERVSVDHVRRAVKYTGKDKILHVYGPTETTVYATFYSVKKVPGNVGTIPIGRPISNTVVYILDNQLLLVPIGVIGEIYIGGSGTARGYLNEQQQTAEKFITNPFIHGDRLYKTGDLGRRLPEGDIEFLGRIDQQVKIRGFRIEPGEIESCLLSHSSIKEAVVLTKENEKNDRYLCAYIVSDIRPLTSELKEFLSAQLPFYMIPSYFVFMEKLPLTPNGKVNWRAFPEPEIVASGDEYTAPRDEVEEKLVEIWSEVLGIEKKIISIHSDFFELGGHSLKATLLISKIHKELNAKIPLPRIFESPSITSLSAYIKGLKKNQHESIPVVEKREYYTLSSAQKRLYILQQMELESTSYNMPIVMPWRGDVEKEKLEEIFKKLIERHESLRTSFAIVEKEPVQKVNDHLEFEIDYYDMESLVINEGDSPQALHSFFSTEAIIKNFIRPFDLSKAPLLRVGLLKSGKGKCIFMLDMHHIITDGTSQAILSKEFMSLYLGEKLSSIKLQYKDFAEWEKSRDQQELMSQQEEYWVRLFSGELPVQNLVTDFPRPEMQSFEGSSEMFVFNEEETKVVKDISKGEEVTLYMYILAIFNILLSKLSGQEEIIVGTPLIARRHSELEQIVGMFVNTLPMLNYPSGEKTFKQFLKEVKEQTFKAYENQEYHFENLVDKILIRRDTSRNPVFDVTFNLFDQFKDARRLLADGEEERDYEYKHNNSKFDLSLTAIDMGERLTFNLEYCTKLFKKETIKRFFIYLKGIVNSVIENSSIKISDLEIITESEKEQILYKFNDTWTDYPREISIHGLFQEQVEKTPDNIAAISEDKKLTYRVLNERANQLAGELRERGVTKDKIVGIMVERSLDMLLGLLGILKAEGAYLPIDQEYPKERKIYMLKDSHALILLTQEKYKKKIESALPVVNIESDDFYKRNRDNLKEVNNSGDLAYVIYTSGSTGRPKGVLVDHRNVVRLVKNTNYIEFKENDRVLQTGALEFDASTFEIWGSLLNGLSLYLVEKENLLIAEKLKEIIRKYNIGTMWLTSPLFNQLSGVDIGIFEGLRNLLVGGDMLSPLHINKLRGRYSELNIINGYGPTENTTFSTTFLIRREYEERIPIGQPISNSTAYIIDKSNKLLPIGVVGELCLSGDGIARGYLNNPGLTVEKFIENPFVLACPHSLLPSQMTAHNSPMTSLLYRTGDIARWLACGNIDFLGRIDHQIKIRGFRIEPGEIKSCLLSHDSIKEAVILAKGDEKNEKFLCAYIVSDKNLLISELKEFLSAQLPFYMIPSYFVFIEKIPLTPNGKVDWKALPKPRAKAAKEYVPPSNTIEEKLVEVWQEVLRIDRIGVTDNFFDLGGDSIKAIYVSASLKKYGLELKLRDLFLYSEIKQLGKCVRKVTHTTYQGIVEGEVPLTPIQKWFFEKNSTRRYHFNQDVLLFRSKGFNESFVEKILQKIVEHHDALRMVYIEEESNIIQKNRGLGKKLFHLETVNLEGLEDIKGEIEREASRMQQELDINEGPLVKIGLFKSLQGDHLLIIIHHLVVDGVSWRILLEDFVIGYSQLLKGEEIKFQAKTDSYRCWADKLTEYAESKQALKELDYWKEVIDTEVEKLPIDHKIGLEEQKYRYSDSETLCMVLDKENTDILFHLANRAYNTEINDILLTALGMSLKDWAGIEKILLILEGHGRESIIENVDISRTVGWFTTRYPVVLSINKAGDLANNIILIKETLRHIPNKGINYGISRYLIPDDDKKGGLSLACEPEISFNYLGEFVQEDRPDTGSIRFSSMNKGDNISPESELYTSIDINGLVVDRILLLSFTYNKHQFERHTLEQLVGQYRSNLIKIIEHCCQKEESELTPSDFTVKNMDMEELDNIVEMVADI